MSDFEDNLIPIEGGDPDAGDSTEIHSTAHVLPMEQIYGSPRGDQHRLRDKARQLEDEADPSAGVIADLVSSPSSDPLGGLRRTGRRLGRAAEDITTDPVDFLLGGAQGATANWLDELTGAAGVLGQMGSVSGMPGSLDDYGTDPAQVYERVRDDTRAASAEARQRSPYGYGAGEITGALATAPLAAEARAPTALGRGIQAVRGGALYGGLSSSGASEGAGDELIADTGEGVFGGGLAGGLLGTGAEALEGVGATASRQGSRFLDYLRELADEARVRAATGGGPLRQEIVRAAPGGLRGEADRIRAMGLTGIGRRPSEVATAAQEAIARSGTTAESRAAREAGALPPTPRDPALQLGFSEDPSPFAGEFGDLAATASPEARAAAEARLATARRARDFSRAATPPASSDPATTLLGGAGGLGALGLAAAEHGGAALGVGGTVALGAAARALRGRGAALSATGLDAVRALLERGGGAASALGRYSDVLRRAMERGPGALAATHDILSRTDPEYATTIAEATSAPEPETRTLTPFEAQLIAADGAEAR